MKSGLDVFDFKEEDELPDFVARKLVDKFRNPKDVEESPRSSSPGAKFDFPVRVDREALTSSREVATCRSVGVLTNTLGASSSVDFLMRNADVKNEITDARAHDDTCTFSTKLSCSETQPMGSPMFQGQVVNKKLGFEQGGGEVAPSLDAPGVVENGEVSNGCGSSSNCSDMETDSIHVAVDYLLYRDRYCTECFVTFTSGGIKIHVSDLNYHLGGCNFERSVDDIIQIEVKRLHQFNYVMVKIKVSPETGTLSDKDNENSGVEELEFTVVDPEWSRKWEAVANMNEKYAALSNAAFEEGSIDSATNLHQRKPYFPKFDADFEDVIYPKGDSDAVSISKRDVELLQPETFVNDTIIDFYIKYLKNQIPPEEKHRYHFFNCFFFRKLADLDQDPSSASDGRAAFLRVRKWTRKVNLFGKDYIFIPVNFNLHWSLLVFCHLGETISFDVNDSNASISVPCILHMDSIKGSHDCLKDLVQRYLWEEWIERHKGTPEDLSIKFLNLRFISLELPQQENLYDCGLFLLHYLELFLAEAPLNFNPFAIDEDSKFLTADWFPPAEASLKRILIQRLISKLLENRTNDDLPSDGSDDDMQDAINQVEVVSANLPPCHTDLSDPHGHGIEITLLGAASAKNSPCMNNQELVLRELLEPGAAAVPLLDHCSSFGRQTCYLDHSSQMEEDTRADSQFMYFPCENSLPQMTDETRPGSGISYSSAGFGSDSWKLSCLAEEDEESMDSSPCSSDDSDIGIIENSSNLDRPENGEDEATNNVQRQKEGFASAYDIGECGIQEAVNADDTAEPLHSLKNPPSSL